jgi:hypothetical protein
MKTVRFATVVEAAGRPDVHILLTRPENDSALQAAIKAHRVMTVHQDRIRRRADHGTIGFDPGLSRQFLIFPRSLSQFAGRSIVAIKYDLLQDGESQAESKSPKTTKRKRTSGSKTKRLETSTTKIIPFTKVVSQEEPDPNNDRFDDPSEQLHRAMELLKQGRQDAAVALLRKLSRDLRPSRSRSPKS